MPLVKVFEWFSILLKIHISGSVEGCRRVFRRNPRLAYTWAIKHGLVDLYSMIDLKLATEEELSSLIRSTFI